MIGGGTQNTRARTHTNARTQREMAAQAEEGLKRTPPSDPGEPVDEPRRSTGRTGWTVTPETALRELFEVADEDHSGFLERDEVARFVELLRPSKQMTNADVDMAMFAMDPEGTGTVTFESFRRWWMSGGARTAAERRECVEVRARASPQESVRAVFNRIDLDGGGTLDRDEIRRAGTILGKIFTSQELDEAMSTMDTAGTGEIDFTSFYAWYTSHRSGMLGDICSARRIGVTATLEADKTARRSELAAREELMEAHTRLVGTSKMRKLFDEIDVDGSGVLDEEEVVAFIRKLKPTKFMGMAQRKEAMAAMDVDGSGEVTFDEFCKWWSAGGSVTTGERLETKMDNTSEELGKVLADLQKCREARANFEDATEAVRKKGLLVIPTRLPSTR